MLDEFKNASNPAISVQLPAIIVRLHVSKKRTRR